MGAHPKFSNGYRLAEQPPRDQPLKHDGRDLAAVGIGHQRVAVADDATLREIDLRDVASRDNDRAHASGDGARRLTEVR